MPVQIIEAIPRNSTAPDAPKKLRCAYYARISLDEDGTNTSIAGQKAYFEVTSRTILSMWHRVPTMMTESQAPAPASATVLTRCCETWKTTSWTLSL